MNNFYQHKKYRDFGLIFSTNIEKLANNSRIKNLIFHQE